MTTRAAAKKRRETQGHTELRRLVESRYTNNISACARDVGVTMPAMHRWLWRNSVPTYASRALIKTVLGIEPSSWTRYNKTAKKTAAKKKGS